MTIALFLTSGFSQANIRLNTETIINQSLKQSSLPLSVIGINETNSLNVTNLNYNYSSAPLNIDPVSLDTLNSTIYKHPDMTGFFFLPPNDTGQDQIAVSDLK